MLGVFRHEQNGLIDEATRERMRLIVPHIRRSLLVGRTIEMKTAETATFASTLDGLSAGLFLVDESARVVHANVSGNAMLTEGAVVRAPGGRLVAREIAAQRTLSEIFAKAGHGDAALGIKGIAVPMNGANGEQYVAHVLPLTNGARRRTGSNFSAAAALFLQSATTEAPAPAEAIAKSFKLTPSELRVLLTIVQVNGVGEAAEVLGIGEATVKTHLHRLFQKTGTNRQADLVKLVARFSSPFM
jgi:DNA-binding CsgD family transcriptional regulator